MKSGFDFVCDLAMDFLAWSAAAVKADCILVVPLFPQESRPRRRTQTEGTKGSGINHPPVAGAGNEHAQTGGFKG